MEKLFNKSIREVEETFIPSLLENAVEYSE
jgi:hypothetical protein